MTHIRKLLIGAALTTFTAAAFAQSGTLNPPSSAGATGVEAPTQTPDVAGLRGTGPAPQPLTAPGPTDPLVQKRDEDARANADYRADAKSARSAYKGQVKHAKTDYKSQVKSARAQRKADRRAANDQMREQMQGVPAQQEGGPQRP